VSRAPDVFEAALEAGDTPRRAQERAEAEIRREQRAERRKANRAERAIRRREARECDETLLVTLRASVGEE